MRRKFILALHFYIHFVRYNETPILFDTTKHYTNFTQKKHISRNFFKVQ